MLICAVSFTLVSFSQRVELVQSTAFINPSYAKPPVQNIQAIPVRLLFNGNSPSSDTTINFDVQQFNLPNYPVLIPGSISISRTKWATIIGNRGSFDTVLYIRTSSIDSIKQDEIGHIIIHSQPQYVELRLTEKGMVKTSNNSSVLSPAKSAAPYNPLKYIRLDNKESRMNPIYTKDSAEPRIITMILFRDSVATANDTIPLIIEKLQFPFEPKIKSDNPIIINKDDWKPNDKKATGDTIAKFYNQAELYIKNLFTDSLTDDVMAYIKIKGDDKSFHAIRLTEKGMYSDKSFWVDMGANFNLFENIKANNFYSGVFMFEKDVCGDLSKMGKYKWLKKGGRRISFTGGVYETKSLEVNAVSDSGLVYRDGRSYIFNNTQGGYPVFRDTGKVTTNSTISNLGIFFSPHFRLNRLVTNENGFHWYVSVYAEVLWQRINTTFVYDNTKQAQIYYTAKTDSLYKIPFKEFAKTQDYRTQYLGFGLPLYIKENNFALYINSVLGFTNQKYQILQNNAVTDSSVIKNYKTSDFTTLTGFAQPRHSWNPFLLCQFRMNDERIGITFTGEVRTLLLKNVKPLITLTLSKKFDLAVLYNAITKPFTGTP
jgi:hypothetical protein